MARYDGLKLGDSVLVLYDGVKLEDVDQGIIDSYAVSMETQQSWVTLNALTKAEAGDILDKSPLSKYWNYEIVELFVYDSQSTRLPAVQLN